MESTYLRTFLEVVRLGSFSKAAEVLFITQSAVSRRIKFMEEQYGCLLIDRSGPLLKPTAAGAIVFENAWQMLELETSLAAQLQKLNARPVLAFACTRPFGIAYLPDILKKFMNRFNGKVEIKVSFDMPPLLLQGLRDSRYDLIVVEHWDRLDFSPAKQIPIGSDEMVFVSSPLLGIPAPLAEVDDLVRHRLYRRKEDCCSGKLLAENMTATGRDPKEFGNVFIYDDLHVIIESVKAGEGIAFISRSLVEKDLENGLLAEHRVAGFCHIRSRTLVYHEEILQNLTIRYFVTCVLEAFGMNSVIPKNS
ncbi:MAG TPA: LysR family transcriptional regulator [Geobacteraceae bacterium]|nr:LysR family transcriptional regulator [Geobacteraceae bacterium]